MKHLTTLALILHSSLFILHSASAAVPLRWTVETSRAQPATFDAYQGETLDLEAALQSYGKPLEAPLDYAFYWQTNGMGNAYWSVPCASVPSPTNVMTATWLPSYDVGARAYNCFIGLTGSIFRAAFQLRLRPSPGAVPNLIDQPPRVLDLANTVVVNPPWPTDATIDSRIREVILQDGITAEVNPAEIKGMVSNTVDKTYVESLGISSGLDTNDVSGMVDAKMDGSLKAVKYPLSDIYHFSIYGEEDEVSLEDLNIANSKVSTTGNVQQLLSRIPLRIHGGKNTYRPALTNTENVVGNERLYEWYANFKTEADNVVGLDGKLSSKADASELEPLRIGYQRLYSFQTSATNVNISVTNYPPTAEEAEGRTHFDPTAPDPDLDFSTVPASLRVDETRGGKRTVVDTRDWPFWFFTSKLPGILAAAREYAHEAYTNALVSLAAWASRTATGAENPAGDSTLVVDVPNIWLMTDQTFEKHVAGSNSCWVIRSKNAAVSPGVATNGFLELTDAFGAPYIRLNKTEATFADPPEDGISYDADAGEWLISYSTEAQPRGGANVALQGSADYPGKAILKESDDPLCPAVITWSGSARNWVMHARPKQIDGIDPGRMFFGAVIEIEGQDYIEYLKPVSFSHIVLPNGKKIAPDVPQSATVGSTVTWKVVP